MLKLFCKKHILLPLLTLASISPLFAIDALVEAPTEQQLSATKALRLKTQLASDLPWDQQSYYHYAKDTPLPELLSSFGAIQGINIVVDPDVKGTVNGKFEGIAPGKFLQQLSDAHNLIWYYDGNILFVYPGSKIESRVLNIVNLDTDKLSETLETLGVVSPQSSIRMFEDGGVVFVSGPSGYVNLVSNLATRIEKKMDIVQWRQPIVKVFPLQYAWAYDVSFASGNNSITIPGVTQTLRALMATGTDSGPGVTGDQVTPNKTSSTSQKMDKMMGTGLVKSDKAKEIATGQEALGKLASGDLKDNNNNQLPGLVSPSFIQADTRLNAIIIRDVPEKMAQYEAIIKTLDTPIKLIEISAMIVDINTNDGLSLGNQYLKVEDKKNRGEFISFNNASAANTGSASATSGFNVGVPIRSVVGSFRVTSQIQALQSQGRARILARPTVLTMNNIAATISRTQTFYVQLAGDRQVDLVNVSAGTTMNVTPCVIEEEGQTKIKLFISIQDGSIDTTANVANLPRVANDSITTQAVILEQQSLLVGGYYRQQEGIKETGIPILKEIPLLGMLFKTKTKSKDIVERMFLITPRIVDISTEGAVNVQTHFNHPISPIAKGPYPPANEQKRRPDQTYNLKNDLKEVTQTAIYPGIARDDRPDQSLNAAQANSQPEQAIEPVQPKKQKKYLFQRRKRSTSSSSSLE